MPLLITLTLFAASAAPDALPEHLPRYDLAIEVDVEGHAVRVRQTATWTNPHPTPTDRVVFNAHARHVVPPNQIGLTAKTLEILRVSPGDAMGVREPALDVTSVTLDGRPMNFTYEGDTKTDLVVPLGRTV